MSANRFGNRFSITSFGESHGPALGVVIDGCPAGVKWQQEMLLHELERRRPGQKGSVQEAIVTARNETDTPEILSGVYQELTLGTPITMIVRNHNQRSEDYHGIEKKPRQGHADQAWLAKFGHADLRGGGRASGRETVSRVLGGAVAKMLLSQHSQQTSVWAFACKIADIELTEDEKLAAETLFAKASPEKNPVDQFVARFPQLQKSEEIGALLVEAKNRGQSYGGVVELWIENCLPYLGQPVFHKLKSDLAAAYMSLGATAAVEFGAGVAASGQAGTEFHDIDTQVYGGLRGGISTGEKIICRIHFKPTSSILDIAKKGRHDPCIVPRAIPVLEAMTHLVLADHLLWSLSDRLDNKFSDRLHL